MGSSASRFDGLFTKTSSSSSSSTSSTAPPITRTFSLPNPLVHHPPLKKGDTHHLVSLTSTTYGSLRLLDNHFAANPNSDDQDHPNSSKTLTLETQQDPSSDSVINTWELMEGLDDFDSSARPTSASVLDRSFTVNHYTAAEFSRKPYPCFARSGSVKKLCDSFESARLANTENSVKKVCNSIESSEVAAAENSSSKPLWKHLSEEALLADMDPSVASSFRRALSSRQVGFNQFRTMRPVGSGSRFSPLFDHRIRLPGTEDKIVLYFTSLRGIRRTYEDCCAVRMIFRGFRVPVDERDISMDSAYRKELQSVLKEKIVSLPQVFIRGKYVGGADEIKQLHEVGELAKLLEGFPVQNPGFVCESCGDARFILCSHCSGSRKIFEEDEGQLRRCPECNENGLIRCPDCCS